MENTPKDWDLPDWDSAEKVHDWRNYVTLEVQELWPTFTAEQKQALARQAAEIASNEEWD